MKKRVTESLNFITVLGLVESIYRNELWKHCQFALTSIENPNFRAFSVIPTKSSVVQSVAIKKANLTTEGACNLS